MSRIIIALICFCICSCTNINTPEGQHKLGVLIASVYQYKESSMPLRYKVAAKIAYRVLSLVTESAEQSNDLDTIRASIDEYGKVHQLDQEQVELAKLTFTQVFVRAELGKVSSHLRLERLRHIKSGIDSIVN